jgi:hypothetical protein
LYIEGPISLTRHDGMGKTIYIFGDRHVDFDYPCPVEYDKAMIIHLKVFLDTLCMEHEFDRNQLDLFFEMARYDKEEIKFNYKSVSTHAISQIPDALLRQYHRKPYSEYIRVHYMDIRYTHELKDTEDPNLIISLKWFLKGFHKKRVTMDDPVKVHKILLGMFPMLYDPFIPTLERITNELIQYEEISHVHKNIRAVSDPLIRGELENRLLNVRNETLQQLVSLSDLLREYYTEYDTNGTINPDKMRTIIELMIKDNFLMEYMDIYLLSRIFKSFKDGPDTSRIVIFVGDAHANKYRESLREWGFNEQVIQDRSYYGDTNCVHVPAEHLPFFKPLY